MKRILRLMHYMFAVALLASLVLSGCAGTSAPPEKKQRMFWPLPPEKPRLELIKNYYNQNDFEKYQSLSAMSLIFGEEPDIIMGRPFDVASDSRNRVFVTDVGSGAIKLFDFAAQKSKYVEFPVQFQSPYGLWVDSKDNIYVADGLLQEVLMFSPDFKYLRSYGNKDDLGNPTHVAIDERRDRLFISDARGHQVQVYKWSDGSHLQTIGDASAEDKARLYGPQGLVTNDQGHLFVCDMLHSRIVEYDLEGRYVKHFGAIGDAISLFEFPKDIAIDQDGNLHIVDIRKAAMLSYTQDGNFLLITGAGKRSTRPSGFVMPSGIWIDKDNQLFIADQLARRFSKWQYFSEAYYQANPDFWK